MDTNDQPAIIVKNLYKTFRIPLDKSSGIKQSIVRFSKKKKGYREFNVLRDISFEIKKGEFFGIVGRNGSGKSTLLKLLAGIYVPDKGLVQVNGSLTPFIELGVGFNPELTGRENVFLNGALLGFNKKEMQAMYDEIVEFAELQDFMAEKLKNFSSGMQVRLAFSIAIRAQSDVLIMDEVLAVGDSAFQKKCLDVFRELKKQGRTIILVTHDMANVEKFCDRALVLQDGEILALTTPHKASLLYAQLNIEDSDTTIKSDRRWGTGEIKVKSAKAVTSGPKSSLQTGEPLEIKVNLERSKGFESAPVLVGLGIYNQDGVVVLGPNSHHVTFSDTATEVTFKLKSFPFAPGEYKVTIAVYDPEETTSYDILDKWIKFSVLSDHAVHGVAELDAKWEAN